MACFIDRTIGRHDLHENQQRLSRSEIHQDEIGQIAAGVDREADCLRQSVIACHHLIAALAQPDDAGLLEKGKRTPSPPLRGQAASDRALSGLQFQGSKQVDSVAWVLGDAVEHLGDGPLRSGATTSC